MIQSSELILNPDGSVYHLNLKPEHIANDIIFVGDQNRVEKSRSSLTALNFLRRKGNLKHRPELTKEKELQ